MLSIPSVPQPQKLSLYLKLCVSRIRNSFYIVIVQKLKAILKVVFIAIKQWSHLLLTLSGYNTLCQLKCLKWPERPFIMWGIHSQEAFPASVILSREKGRTPGRCVGGSRSLDQGRHLWNFHPTDGNGVDRVLRSLAGRGAGMFESQLLFLIRLCDSSSFSRCLAFYLPLLPEHLFAEVMFTSPAQVGGTWWELNIQKT